MLKKEAQHGGITPAMRQYLLVKEQYPDCVLLFRMGDFYEMFFDDALTAAPVLEIALTTRNKNKEGAVPLCGFPYHAADAYIAKLIKNGFKVAVCEQMEDPKMAKGVVKRDVIRVITPGLATDSLEEKENNFLLAIASADNVFGYALIDATTGELFVGAVSEKEALRDCITDFNWSEAIVSEECGEMDLSKNRAPFCVTRCRQSDLNENDLLALKETFPQLFLETHAFEKNGAAYTALLMALLYVKNTQKEYTPPIFNASWHEPQNFLVIDDIAKTNLEIFASLSGGNQGYLFKIIDRATTPMGARKLKWWLAAPLKNVAQIEARQSAIGTLKEAHRTRDGLRQTLKRIGDIERLTGRITMALANARDVVALKNSLAELPEVKTALETFDVPLLAEINEKIELFPDVVSLIDKAIVENPPATIREGNIIKRGYDAPLDEIVAISRDGKRWIASLEEKERRRTGIPSLKIGFNNIFGYYIEITKTHSAQAPPEYIRKQTLVNAERYINEELKGYEETVLGAEEKIKEKEYLLFCAARADIAKQAQRMRTTAAAIAEMDCLVALADVANRNGYVRPVVDDGDVIEIKEGRHPVIEKMNLAEAFVPNDTLLDMAQNRLLIITGPNMAGKSTYIRQVALLVILAQMGSFVPAASMRLGLVDRIFTRVGAADNLARGQSTFMVEMVEVANILNNATSRSLIVLDEVGRGTSTFDGMSIAWATAEYVHSKNKLGARTLFATHYHQLTELALSHEGAKNYNIAVREYGERIIFLRKIIEGGTNRSYGIQVARLAGVPAEVIGRAKEILRDLERKEFNLGGAHSSSASGGKGAQMVLFDQEGESIVEEIKSLMLETLIPIEALNMISHWQKKLKS